MGRHDNSKINITQYNQHIINYTGCWFNKVLRWCLISLNGDKKKSPPRKAEAEWAQALFLLAKAQLQNIANNPGEFVVEMRQATAEILRKRNSP